MIVPTIHMNGSSKKTLIANLRTAYESLSESLDNLYSCAPNERDYYVQEENSYEQAKEEYYDRLSRIQSVVDELQALMIAIDIQ